MSGQRPARDPSDPTTYMPVWAGRAAVVIFGIGTVVLGVLWLAGDGSGETAFWCLVAFLAAAGMAVQRHRAGYHW